MAVIEHPVNSSEAWSARALISEPWTACGWSKHGQEARFHAVVAALNLQPGERLLDYGCGTGRLAEFLPGGVDYVGVDWAEGMRLRARLEHPSARIVEKVPFGRFDAVACIGVFNLPGTKQDAFHTIRWLWETTGCRVLVASLYAGDDPACLSYTEAEAVRCGALLAYHVTVERILPNDLLLRITR